MKITRSLTMNREDYGAIIFIAGEYVGKIVRLKPDEEIYIGRDAKTCNIVMHSEEISRNHCIVRYDCKERKYYVTDISMNGIFICINGTNKLLTMEKEYGLIPETEIILAGGRDKIILG
ncbi:MAG: FHA domain-containing protein [Lachnospiraceae bacterium]|nr:FHA domain-containing protein [Lachnospiraceae bacterium]